MTNRILETRSIMRGYDPPNKYTGDRNKIYKIFKQTGIGKVEDMLETLEKKLDYILQFIVLEEK